MSEINLQPWEELVKGGSVPFRRAVAARKEPECIEETICVSGAIAGRSELFIRIIGPRPNGFLGPTLVRFTPSEVEVAITQLSSGVTQTYPGSHPAGDRRAARPPGPRGLPA
jgi:hypothetical protein